MSLNLAAMIDVVFLLLAYFMVATDFRVEEVFRMDLPRRQVRAALLPLDGGPLHIAVASTGASGYLLTIEGPWPVVATFEDLHAFLLNRRLDGGDGGGLFPRDHPIIVQPTDATSWDHAIGAFNAVIRAEYVNVRFDRTPST